MSEQVRSVYRGVYSRLRDSGSSSTIASAIRKPWKAMLSANGTRWQGPPRATEKEAAIDYDTRVLELGADRPLNILKPKKTNAT